MTETTQASPKRGRPSIFTEELGDIICVRIMDGEHLASICRADEMPASRTVFLWVLRDEKFAVKYNEARRVQRDGMVEEIITIADKKLNFRDPEVARAKIAHREQRLKSRQFILTKMDDRFRERVQVEHKGGMGVRIEGGLPDDEILPAPLAGS